MDEEERFEIYGGSKEEKGVKAYLPGPMGYYAKTLKLYFIIGDLDLPERRDIPVVGWRRKKTHRAAHVAKYTKVEPT